MVVEIFVIGTVAVLTAVYAVRQRAGRKADPRPRTAAEELEWQRAIK
jgi:hypothetical protein